MSNLHVIIVFGANGSGKTTLGRELARILYFKRIDVEDYYFLPSEIPYMVSRTKDEVIDLILEDINKHGSFVLSSVIGDYGDKELGDIPEYEMAEVKLFDTKPDKMRFPQILPVLFEKIKDVYTEDMK